MAKMLWETSSDPTATACLAAYVIRRLPGTHCESWLVDERAGAYEAGAKALFENLFEQEERFDEDTDFFKEYMYFVADGRTLKPPRASAQRFLLGSDHEEMNSDHHSEYSALSSTEKKLHFRRRVSLVVITMLCPLVVFDVI